jgi:hypothetical protein
VVTIGAELTGRWMGNEPPVLAVRPVALAVGVAVWMALAVAVAQRVAVAVWQWRERAGCGSAVILSGDNRSRIDWEMDGK